MRVFRAARALVTHDEDGRHTHHDSTSDATEVSSSHTPTATATSSTNTTHATVRLHRQHHQKRRNSGASAVAEAIDITMKNAIESLAQDDAESALVFALVHDSEFRLATAIASVRDPPTY